MVDVAERSDECLAQTVEVMGLNIFTGLTLCLHLPLADALWPGFQELEECCDRDDPDRMDLVKAQKVVVSADQPVHSCRCRTGDELGILRVSNLVRVGKGSAHRRLPRYPLAQAQQEKMDWLLFWGFAGSFALEEAGESI